MLIVCYEWICILYIEEAYFKVFIGLEFYETSGNGKDFMSIRESAYITFQEAIGIHNRLIRTDSESHSSSIIMSVSCMWMFIIKKRKPC
jgi:hypothetical protein